MSKEVIKTPSPLPGNTILGNVFALRASIDESGSLPSRIKILAWGDNLGRTTGAKIVVGEKTQACLAANQKRFARDLVALDYEHQSVKGHPNYKQDPRHNAAHGEIEIVPGEGVYLSSINFTPNGREHALSYADVSAVAHTDKDGNLLMISSVALTQAGDVAGMLFEDAVAALSAGDPTTHEKPKTEMEKNETTDKFRALLVTLLGIKPADGEDEVTDEAIVSAAGKFGESNVVPMTAEKPEDEGHALSARLDQLEKDNAVQGAVIEGKVIPLSAEDIAVMPLANLKSLIARLEANVVPLSSTLQKEIPGEDGVALSADDSAVMKELGLTKEEFLAGRK